MIRSIRIAATVGAAALFTASGGYAGTITGKIVYEGEVPASLSKPIDISADPHCLTHASDKPVLNEVLVLGEGNTMANIIVKVIKGLPDKKWEPPTEPVKMTQEGCKYSPHVNVVQLGQPLYVLNPDKIFHNVNCAPKLNAPANRAMPQNMRVLEFNFDKLEPEPFRFKCDVHPWMMAWCAVVDHPFFDITETDGIYKIENLDPGEYEIEAWHEKLGVQTGTVTVTADAPAEFNFTFTRPTAK